MTAPNNSEVYQHPRYCAIGDRWNTEEERAFIDACLQRMISALQER